MLKEAITYVYEKAAELANKQKANKVDWLSNPRMAVFEMNGQLLERPVPPELRKHTVDSVFDLILAATAWVGTEGKGTIWLSHKDIVLIVDDADRRERVTLPLVQSDVFEKMCELDQKPVMDQLTLIRLLRRHFRNATEASVVLAAVRKIKFNRNESGHSNLQHGNESIGRTIEAEIAGAADIPDRLTVPLNVYSNPGERDNVVSVAFDLEIDVHQQKFSLKPQPDEITTVIEQSLGTIRRRIMAGAPKGMPILYGTP
jgi:hypothetical protein